MSTPGPDMTWEPFGPAFFICSLHTFPANIILGRAEVLSLLCTEPLAVFMCYSLIVPWCRKLVFIGYLL